MDGPAAGSTGMNGPHMTIGHAILNGLLDSEAPE